MKNTIGGTSFCALANRPGKGDSLAKQRPGTRFQNHAGAFEGRAKRAAFVVVLVVAVSAMTLLASHTASAQSCNLVTTLPSCLSCVPANVAFVNLYWSSNLSTWDANAPNGLTTQRIDAFTQALIDSTYFEDSATSYNTGVPTFNGSIADATDAPTTDLLVMSHEVNHVTATAPFNALPRLFVNVFVPSGTIPSEPVVGTTCPVIAGFHTQSDGLGTGFTVIPVDTRCNPTFDSVMKTLSHEMIETMTDAGGIAGERDWSTFLQTLGEDEVADICQNGSQIGDPSITRILGPHPFLITQVDSYFSNATCSCVPPWPNNTGPFPLTLSLTAAGAMQVQMTSSLALGQIPPEFGLPSATAPVTNTPYLWLNATNRAGTTYAFAGDVLDTTDLNAPEQVVQISQWNGNTVTASVPTAFATYCDTLTLAAWNPKGGTKATGQTMFGSTLTISLSVAAAARTGAPVTVTGFVKDGNGIPVQGAPVTISDTAGDFRPFELTTNAAGMYSSTFMAGHGSDTVTATTTDCGGGAVTSSRPITGCAVGGVGAGRGAGAAAELGVLLGCAALVRRRTRTAAS